MAYVLTDELWLPQPPEVLFPFFADASNLGVLTPGWLQFQILTPMPVELGVGAIIDYQIKLHGIPLRWRTGFTLWDPPHRFVDVQLRGPYTKWEHLHTFTPQNGGTLVADHADYDMLCGPLVHRLFVKPDLDRIFTYRRAKMLELFAAPAP